MLLIGGVSAGALSACQSASNAAPRAVMGSGGPPPANNAQPATGGGQNAALPKAPPKLDLAVMRAKIDAKEAGYFLLDARLPDEFAAGHLPTAVNVPFSEVKNRLAAIPKDKEVIVYCYGRGCSTSKAVAIMLQDAGWPDVKELDGGVPEWQQAGYPVVK